MRGWIAWTGPPVLVEELWFKTRHERLLLQRPAAAEGHLTCHESKHRQSRRRTITNRSAFERRMQCRETSP
jgi:hypothetical protein